MHGAKFCGLCRCVRAQAVLMQYLSSARDVILFSLAFAGAPFSSDEVGTCRFAALCRLYSVCGLAIVEMGRGEETARDACPANSGRNTILVACKWRGVEPKAQLLLLVLLLIMTLGAAEQGGGLH